MATKIPVFMNIVSKMKGIFYGWWIVTACFLMAVYAGGVVGWGFTSVFEPIKNELGWTSAQIAFSSSLRGMETGLLAPGVGLLIDRFGPKSIMFTGGIFAGLGLMLMGSVRTLPMFYTASALIALGLSLCSANALQIAVATWFRRKISLALGLMSCGWGVSGLLIPVVVWVVDKFGWRASQVYFGIGMFLFILPFSLIVRRRPEDYGMQPDGDSSLAVSDERPVSKATGSKGISTRQAFGSRAFWIIAVTMAAQNMIVSSVSTHVMPYLTSVGYSREVAGFMASGIPLASIIGRFGFGWLGDRVSTKKLTIFGFGILALGMISFAYALWGLFIIAVFLLTFGIGFGGINTMRAVLPQTYFGIKSYGTILGLVMGVGTFGSMVGAPLAGYTFDTLGRYQPIWLIYAAAAGLCLLATLFMPAVKKIESEAKPLKGE